MADGTFTMSERATRFHAIANLLSNQRDARIVHAYADEIERLAIEQRLLCGCDCSFQTLRQVASRARGVRPFPDGRPADHLYCGDSLCYCYKANGETGINNLLTEL